MFINIAAYIRRVLCLRSAGADLKENQAVSKAVFDEREGLWTVSIEDSSTTYKCRVRFSFMTIVLIIISHEHDELQQKARIKYCSESEL